MKKEMLINVLQPEECRIAILEDGVLEELYVERTSHESYTGNIYKGRVVNLEPAIQAAFVDFSVGRNGFLHVSDVEPQYYRRNLSEQAELNPRDRDREREPRRDQPRGAEPRRDRAPRPAEGIDREPPPGGGGFGEGLIDPRRERPDRSERGRRDRSEPRRFGEGLEGDESQSQRPPASRPAEPDRFAPEEPPRRLRSEVPPPAPARPPVDSPYLRAPAPEPVVRDEPVVERSPYSRRPAPAPAAPPAPIAPIEREEPVVERPRGLGAGFIRPSEPEPIDPDLPPSRTQRSRPAPPRPIEDEAKARPAPAPRDFEPEPETPSAREPRRGRGRGRNRTAPEAEVPAPFEPIAEAEPAGFDAPAEPIADESPRRRGGRDAIRSRGGDRPQPERPQPERTRPAPPAPPAERARPFAAELEADRPQPSEPEWARTPVPEKTRSYAPDREADRPQPTVPERARPTPPPERTRSFAAELDIDRPQPAPPERSRPAPPPERPRPAAPERPRSFAAELDVDRPQPTAPEPTREPTRERGRPPERARNPEFEAPARDPRAKPHDRAGEEGYIPRRLRHGGTEAEAAPASWPDLVDDEETATGPDSDEDGEGGDDQEGGTTKEGGRRRRRRRGRRRDRDVVDRAPAAPEADEADDLAEPDDFEEAVPAHREPIEAHASDLDDIATSADFDFGDDHGSDEFDDEDDDDDLAPKTPRVSDPDDQIDPELEEEIRKEIEEIAELEREMGLRGTVEARPRRGDDAGKGGVRGRGTIKPPIQEIFRRGDEVLIQVIKESIGTKGPTLSTYISIPGRYLVLMPGLNRVGVSRKIADEGQRRKLREIMNELNPPKGLGFIVRTAGLDRSKRELARDLAYLLRLWKVILRRIKKAKSPAPIYQESDMITRTIRDIFTSEIDTIWIDEPAAFERAQEFLRVVMPRFVDRLKLYDEKVPLFHKYGIEDEIAKIQRRRVDLPEGGSIVIDQTEALVAIDVNSGNFRVENDAERTAYEMNLRAAKEIARQLRLRDLGGVIVNDFIDMRDEKNRRGVEHVLRDAIKRDRARTKVLRMSQFGLIEMTRQRIRPSLKRSVYEDCTHCAGAGVVKTTESMSIDVMRILALASHREEIRRVNIGVHPGVAVHLNNRKRKEIARIELDANMTIHIRHEADAPAEHLQVDCFDANNNEVRLFPPAAPDRHHHHRRGAH